MGILEFLLFFVILSGMKCSRRISGKAKLCSEIAIAVKFVQCTSEIAIAVKFAAGELGDASNYRIAKQSFAVIFAFSSGSRFPRKRGKCLLADKRGAPC
jgi:hypothetical protein